MNTLICNAAEGLLQIALLREHEVLCAQEWPAPTRSTEILAPALAHMVQELGMTMHDISRIACVNGPGSFTGIRLVLSTAAALRRVTKASVAPLDYMEALALSAYMRASEHPYPAANYADRQADNRASGMAVTLGAPQSAYLWVLTHARRNLVHCQPFTFHTHAVSNGQAQNNAPPTNARLSEGLPSVLHPQPLAPVDLCSLEVCAQRITASGRPLCVGSGVQRNEAFFQQHCPQAHFGGPSFATISIPALVQLAEHASYGHNDLEPLYVRPCDAVENLPAMAEKLGQDATHAEQRLNELLQRPTSPDQCYRPNNA